jgi:hypothetical protein
MTPETFVDNFLILIPPVTEGEAQAQIAAGTHIKAVNEDAFDPAGYHIKADRAHLMGIAFYREDDDSESPMFGFRISAAEDVWREGGETLAVWTGVEHEPTSRSHTSHSQTGTTGLKAETD